MGDPNRLEKLRDWRILLMMVLERSLICVWGDAFAHASVSVVSVSDSAIGDNFMVKF